MSSRTPRSLVESALVGKETVLGVVNLTYPSLGF